MYTESELRDAFAYSAARADTMVADGLDELLTELADELDPAPRAVRHRPRILVALAAAACVVAVGAAAVALSRPAGSGAHQHAATTFPGPRSSTPSPVPASTFAARADVATPHTAAGVSAVNDYAVAGVQGVTYSLAGDASGGRVEQVNRHLDAQSLIVVTVVAKSSGFDPGRFPRARPVQVGARTGYYARFRLFPLVGSDNAAKYSSAWTIAIPVGHGTWAFAEIDILSANATATRDDPAAIAAGFVGLRLRFGSNLLRLPIRTGYLPAGTSVSLLNYTDDDPPSLVLQFTGPSGRNFEVDVIGAVGSPTDTTCTQAGLQCPKTVTRDVGGLRVQVSGYGYGYGTTALAKVAKTITVSTDRKDWWTVHEAFG